MNELRRWGKHDFNPSRDDVFQERLYCIQWITKASIQKSRKETFFASVSKDDLEREQRVDSVVAENLENWQFSGFAPDMFIEMGGPPRYQGRDLVIARGWAYWHQLFNSRQILMASMMIRNGHNCNLWVALGAILK